MAKIEEAYISFETAKLLKEKGLLEGLEKEEISAYFTHAYTDEGKEVWGIYSNRYYPCLTQSMAMNWLLVEHTVWLSVYPDIREDKGVVWICDIYDGDCEILDSLSSEPDEWMPTPFIDRCIRQCLKNFI